MTDTLSGKTPALGKVFLKYLFSSIGSAVVVSVYSIVDCIMVGQYEGPRGTAALAVIMGIPVVASDNRGTREYMEPGKNGFVCPPHDVEGFIRGIEAVRRMPEEAKREMAAFCRESTEPFDIRHAREAMREIYAQADRLVRAGRGARPRHGVLPIRLAAGRRESGKRPALPEAEERAAHKEAAGPWETP